MATVLRMPSVLAGATEAAIASWLVRPGDAVTAGTPVAEIETEKALVEYAAEEAGVIGRLVLGEGDSGQIGDPIAVLVAPGETDADIDTALGVADAAAPAPAGPAGSAVPAAGSAVPAAATAGGSGPAANGHPDPAAGRRLFASPLVRKVAGQRRVDLARLTGTGPNGRIVRRDLERFLAAGPAASGPVETDAVAAVETDAAVAVETNAVAAVETNADAAVPDGATLIPHTPMRRAIARRLTQSTTTIPHFSLTAECLVDTLLALRRQVNDTAAAGGPGAVKVSVNDFVLAAAAAAFGDVPEANVTWTDEGLLAYRSVDLAIAVATGTGLVTPVLRGVESKRLSAVARESAALAQRARDRKLRQGELEGGTLTVSNLGMYGTPGFTAIINPPQSAILAVGAARPQPVVANGAVVPATVMRCTLSVDHRAIDGALAARWLAAFTARIENPLSTLV
ncbi:MAG TPA: dihydrolipoamide acetyltransferase family protein [Trebonia sp.]